MSVTHGGRGAGPAGPHLRDPTYGSHLRVPPTGRADTTGSGSLDYGEFVALIQSLRGEAIGPLREAFTKGCPSALPLTLAYLTVPYRALPLPVHARMSQTHAHAATPRPRSRAHPCQLH